ncbi:MAG TPA: hypothetical protein VLZ28_02335 [Daejeonella sp.]|nr:hypothetical protein [Daejeonella sp.]
MNKKKIDQESSMDRPVQGVANTMSNIKYAQLDMRVGYLNGYTGVIVSGVVWFVAGIVAIYLSPVQAMWTLLVGGAFIHPIAILFNKVLGACGSHTPNNPLGQLAMEGTLFMIMCMPLAYALSLQNVDWFFQGMLLIIGGRYLTFATLFGARIYWALGITLGLTAYFLFKLNAEPHISILVASAIEVSFGLVMFVVRKRNS